MMLPVGCACCHLHWLECHATPGQQDVLGANPLIAQWVDNVAVGEGARDQLQQIKLAQASEDFIGPALQLGERFWVICAELLDQGLQGLGVMFYVHIDNVFYEM